MRGLVKLDKIERSLAYAFSFNHFASIKDRATGRACLKTYPCYNDRKKTVIYTIFGNISSMKLVWNIKQLVPSIIRTKFSKEYMQALCYHITVSVQISTQIESLECIVF